MYVLIFYQLYIVVTWIIFYLKSDACEKWPHFSFVVKSLMLLKSLMLVAHGLLLTACCSWSELVDIYQPSLASSYCNCSCSTCNWTPWEGIWMCSWQQLYLFELVGFCFPSRCLWYIFLFHIEICLMSYMKLRLILRKFVMDSNFLSK
jgi:hypothetical protein